MEANSPVGRVLVVDDDQVLRKALCGIVAEGGWETAETAETAVATTVNSMWAALGDLFKCKLPNGIELSIPKLGVETRLIDFVEDDTKLVDRPPGLTSTGCCFRLTAPPRWWASW